MGSFFIDKKGKVLIVGIGLNNNLLMMNTNRHFKINVTNKTKASEKLSSGYRINRAADDASGLQISEKMRSQIRGLERAAANAQDGISWLQTADGALNEVHALLHRMRELTIQSLNDTNTPADRAKCQAEFDALQSEIDDITKKTEFNIKTIFAEHESTYYQFEGNMEWDQSQPHIIHADNNNLILNYRIGESDAIETAVINIDEGIYTTQELIDEIDDAIIAQGLDEKGIVFEYTENGTCNLNIEGGELIDSVDGGLSYLLYETYRGSSMGALIGTTIFTNDYVRLEISSSKNDNILFDIEDFDGNISNVNITIPEGAYTRPELIDYLNAQLTSTDVKASAYGSGIKLEGAASIVTGFKGNMFKIDGTGKIYDSVFYDNVKYGNVTMSKASFVGGNIKPTGAYQEEHYKYKIDSTNNELIFNDTNSSGNTVVMTIPEGEYTVEEMVGKMNQFFADSGLELAASTSSYNSYKGIIINSLVEGSFSKVGVDTECSAFNTLFKIQEYNIFPESATVYNETAPDVKAKVTGAKAFSGTNIPFEIQAGVNDTFILDLDGTDYKISMDAGTYNDAQSIADMINTKFASPTADSAYKDKVEALVSGNNIVLQAVEKTQIKNMKAEADGANKGYDNIFVNHSTYYSYSTIADTGSSTTKPAVTLPGIIGDSTTFTSDNNKLEIKFNESDRVVTFSTGTAMTRDDIVSEIETQIPALATEVPITFTQIYNKGQTIVDEVKIIGTGLTQQNKNITKTAGSSKSIEGIAGVFFDNVGAKAATAVALPDSFTIDSSCNQMQLTINNDTKVLTFADGTYTRNQLVAEIQNKINQAFNEPLKGSATVSLTSDNKLEIQSNLTTNNGFEVFDGAKTKIDFNWNTSSFIRALQTAKTPASAKSTHKLLPNITITDSSNIFAFTYKENGTTKNVSLALDTGTYTNSSFVKELNDKFTENGIKVKAELDSGYLKLTTIEKGSNNSISYSSVSGGNSAEALFGQLVFKTPASTVADADIQDEIVIDDTSNQFNITVENNLHKLTLKNGTYNRADFVQMLDDVFNENSVPISATLEGNRIRYTTDNAGSDITFKLEYNTAGNSMPAIYGKTMAVTPGIDASFSNDGKLQLTSTENGGSISVTSQPNNLFFKATEKDSVTYPSNETGYTSVKKAYIDGVNITEPIKIDQYNNDLSFTYKMNGASKNILITVPDGDYYFTNAGGNQSIVDYLQSEIDAQAGAGQLSVTAGPSGIRIEAVNSGSTYTLSNFSGDFYKKVLGKCEDKTVVAGYSINNGTQQNDIAYTVGRKGIKNKTIDVKPGINDTLKLDFTHDGTVYELEFVLDSGEYANNTIIDEIQKKLDEELVANGLEAGTIEATIGGVNTGVSGANDANALVFKLSNSVRLPGQGQYIIDGVSGNAAFSVFYQTDGELIPAYIKGVKDLSEGLTIKPGETTLSFDCDGVNYTLDLAEGEYTAEEIVNEINSKINAQSILVNAEIEDGLLKLSHKRIGKHTITNINGLAKDDLFFVENGEKDSYEDMKIQVGANSNQLVSLTRKPLNTAFLKINSVAITQPKYANKALLRLDNAIEEVSSVRSEFGSQHNRLTHALANNLNTEENLQAAESRIRDTEMATEIMKHSKNAILEQAATAMQAQMQNMSSNILRLLE